MSTSRLLKIGFLTSCFALLAVALNGCLQAREAILGRYDADKDRFVFLNIYQGIHGEKPGDLEHLINLWNNRDHLITPPIPNILGKTSFLRLSDKQFAVLNLGSPTALDIAASPISLNQITVLPGQFFLRGQDALCYYDQIVVPGAFVDEGLKLLNQTASQAIPPLIAEERDRRAKGGKRTSWEEFRKAVALQALPTKASAEVDGAATKPNPATSPSADAAPEPDPLTVLSDASLDKITKGFADGTMGIVRDKAVFRETIELDENDAKELMKTIDVFRQTVADTLKKPDHDPDLEKQVSLLNAIKSTSPRPGVIELSTDATDLFTRIEAIFDPKADLPAIQGDDAKRAKEAIAALKEKNIPIDDKTTIAQILTDFHAGKLPGHPSEKPVPPGEGLIEKK